MGGGDTFGVVQTARTAVTRETTCELNYPWRVGSYRPMTEINEHVMPMTHENYSRCLCEVRSFDCADGVKHLGQASAFIKERPIHVGRT